MGFKPLEWYCQPVENSVWAMVVENAFGAYAPCGIDSLLICISHLALFGACFYRIWRTKKDATVSWFCLRSPYYNYLLGLLALYCTAEPLFRLVTGTSFVNLDGQTSLSPFEIVLSVIEAASWCSMLIMIGLETKIYILEFRWYIRFVVIYVLIGQTAVFNIVLSVREYYDKRIFYLYTCELICQLVFGILLFVYVPSLDPYPGYTPIRNEVVSDNTAYEPLSGAEQICPERHANVFSRIFFEWVTPLMKQGYKRPITEKDVWKLDSWDETETLNKKFQKCWQEESQRQKPWLLRALHQCLGGRFWLGGLFKIGNDASQFGGPIILELLLENGMPGLRSVGNESESSVMPYAAANFLSPTDSDFPLNQTLTGSNCFDESTLLQNSDNNGGQVNPQNGTFVKVYKSGSFGMSLDITRFSSYAELRSELARLFGLEGQLEDPLRSGWQLVFVDRENDVLLLGDDPWQEFVNNVWCIKILSPQEVQQMARQGVDLLNSVPLKRLSSNSCDDYCQDSRSLNTGITSVGTLDY